MSSMRGFTRGVIWDASRVGLTEGANEYLDARRCAMTNGAEVRPLCRGEPTPSVSRPKTTAGLSKPSSIAIAQEYRGAIDRSVVVHGKPFTHGSAVGLNVVCGSIFLNTWPPTLITNTP